MADKYDDTLFSILQESKTLPNFFDVIFGFLYRRTDFYHVSENPNLGVGLPPNIADRLLYEAFQKYKNHKHESNNCIESPGCSKNLINGEKVLDNKVVDTKLNLDCYNGAQFENYAWSQNITDIDLQVKIPENINSKQLKVEITSTKINISLKNSDNFYLQGELCRKIKTQETVWSITGQILQIHLEKTQESWWDCLLQTEPRLDLSKMDCSRPFYELSEEAQAKIEELTWNQERKRQGLPTSEQLNLQNTLKKAWNVEGSPFTGEFDPTKVDIIH